MNLNEIRERIDKGKRNLQEINPSIKCYMVVRIGHTQYKPDEIAADNPDLVYDESNFEQGQDLGPLIAKARRYRQLKNTNESLRENSIRNKKEIEKNELEMSRIRKELSIKIPTLDFVEAQCELRFEELDYPQIHLIKSHPIVQKIGKTDMSPASIRIVIG